MLRSRSIGSRNNIAREAGFHVLTRFPDRLRDPLQPVPFEAGSRKHLVNVARKVCNVLLIPTTRHLAQIGTTLLPRHSSLMILLHLLHIIIHTFHYLMYYSTWISMLHHLFGQLSTDNLVSIPTYQAYRH